MSPCILVKEKEVVFLFSKALVRAVSQAVLRNTQLEAVRR